MRAFCAFALSALLFASLAFATPKETFSEELFVAPLTGDNLLTQFAFETSLDDFEPKAETATIHADLVPLPILKLFGSNGSLALTELHLRFTQGRYLFGIWGLPKAAPSSLTASSLSAPTGVEFWVEYGHNSRLSSADVDSNYRNLKQLVGGLFSINFGKTEERVVTPTRLPRTQSFATGGSRGPVRYESHPRESVCTENLTPWLKLLPCHSDAGLGVLLAKASNLYNTQFHSMELRIVKTASHKLLLTQTLTMEVAVRGLSRLLVALASLFPTAALSACPVATKSKVHYLSGPNSAPPLEVTIANNSKNGIITPSEFADSTAVDLKKLTEPFVLSATARNLDSLVPSSEVPFLVNRYVLGIGQQDGELVMHFENRFKSSANVSVLFSSPWPIRFYFHSMQTLISAPESPNPKALPREALKIVHLVPSEDRGRPAQLELSFALAPQHHLAITLPFDRVFLHFAEHPPDPHRGYDIGATLVEVTHSDPSALPAFASPLTLITSGHSIMLPTPDFSMMYNVITLTCTVVAMFYGQALNLMARRLSEVYTKSGEFISNRPLARLLRKFLNRGASDDEPTKKEEEGADPTQINSFF